MNELGRYTGRDMGKTNGAGRKAFLREAWFDRDLSWLEFNRRVLCRGAGRPHAAARAAEVPGDLHVEPRRVLHEARRRDAHACLCERGSRGRRRVQFAHGAPARGAVPDAARRRPIASPACGPSSRHRASASPPGTSSSDGAASARRREYFDSHVSPALTPLSLDPSQPVPVHVQPLDVVGLRAARPRDGGDRCTCAVKVPPTIQQWLPLRCGVPDGRALLRLAARDRAATTRTSSSPASRSSRRRCSASRATPTSPSRRTATTASASSSRNRFASGASSRSCASSSTSRRAPRSATGSWTSSSCATATSTSCPGLLDYTTLFEHRFAAGAAVAGPAVDADGPARPRRGGGPVRGDPRRRRAGPSPVRELRRERRALHPRCRGRPGHDDHQDDGVPPGRRHAVRALADHGGRERQAGGLPGRAEGALRRGAQPALGQRAAEGRRPRDLRHAGPQDAHQARAGRAPRGGRPADLRAHRHRQLPRQDGAHVHGLRALHLRPGDHARRGEPVPPPDRVFARAGVRPAAGGAAQHARAVHRADRPRGRARAGGAAGAHRREDQPARGPARVRGARRARRRPACRST